MDARLIVALLLGVSTACAALDPRFDHRHADWDALLKKHVVLLDGGKASRFTYGAAAAERRALKAYLESLSAVGRGEFEGWGRAEQMAFLINAYNAFTVEKVLTRYPDIGSIRDFGRVFGNPFRDRFFTLLGGARSLDELEHGILRKTYGARRLMWALVWRSSWRSRRSDSCPTARATVTAKGASRSRRYSTGSRRTSSRATLTSGATRAPSACRRRSRPRWYSSTTIGR